jgi:hypothetical protein
MICKSKWVYGITVAALSFRLLILLTGYPVEAAAPNLADGTITVPMTTGVIFTGGESYGIGGMIELGPHEGLHGPSFVNTGPVV